jgi:outer membrane protein assembly factor BamB
MRAAWGATAIAVAVALASAGSTGARPVADAEWTTYGHDAQTSGYTLAGTFAAGVKRFLPDWSLKLDGGIVAQPVATRIAGGGALTFFAATEAGSVYAIDDATGTVRWRVPLGTVAANGDCGTWGVSSTPVIDSGRGLLYVVGATGVLHALHLTDGSEAPGFPVRVISRRRTEYVWGALRLLGNRLYVPVSSYCDAPDRLGQPAEGRLLALDVTAPSDSTTYDPVPGPDNLGGIWGWGGVAIAPAGNELYTGVGNAEPDVDDGASDSMVELASDLSETIAVNRPIGTAPGRDTDIGAAPVLFQPAGCPPLLAANDKSGDLVVWRQDALGLGLYARVPLSDGVDAFVGAPSWSPRTQMLYDGGATFERAGKRLVGTIALRVTAACRLAARWSAPTGDSSQPQPLVAGDLVVSTGGSAGGVLVSRAATGVAVWKFPTAAATLSAPMEANGVLAFGDMSGRLYAFRPTG